MYGCVTGLPYSVFLFPGTQPPRMGLVPIREVIGLRCFRLLRKCGQIVFVRASSQLRLFAFLDLTDLVTCCFLPCAGHVSLSVDRASNARLTPIYLQRCTHLIVFPFLPTPPPPVSCLFGLLVQTGRS